MDKVNGIESRMLKITDDYREIVSRPQSNTASQPASRAGCSRVSVNSSVLRWDIELQNNIIAGKNDDIAKQQKEISQQNER